MLAAGLAGCDDGAPAPGPICPTSVMVRQDTGVAANSTILRPEGIEEDLRKTLLYWAGFAGLDVPEPSPALLSEFERIFVKHDWLGLRKVTSARDLHKVANRAALAAVRELLA